jgi:amino acid adenylation domain-containing protein
MDLLKDDIVKTIKRDSLIRGNQVDFFPDTLSGAIEGVLRNRLEDVFILSGEEEYSGRDIINRTDLIADNIYAKIGSNKGIVAVNLSRSFDLICTILAVMRLGCAYLPLSKEHPVARNRQIVIDSKPILIVHKSDDLEINSIGAPEQDCRSLVENSKIPDFGAVDLSPSDCCYVMYTSGSTGVPKGVPITHEGILNRLNWMKNYYAFSASDSLIQKTPLSFDVSIYEMFFPIMSGARLVICDFDRHMDIDYIIDLVLRHEVTYLQFVPQLLRAFLANARSKDCCSLKHLISSGDALDVGLARLCRKTFPQANLYNGYGPTEASIGICHWRFEDRDDIQKPPIGHPIDNVELLIMGDNGKPSGDKAGELWVAGVQLSPGYLNSIERPSLNDAYEFLKIENEDRPKRFYKTGDLVQTNGFGEIVFVGRKDNQIKINGSRIELEEIESIFNTLEGIQQSVAIFDKDKSSPRLFMAYVLKQGFKVSSSEMLKHCIENLPSQAVPSKFIEIEQVVLNDNGKVDRAKISEYVGDKTLKPVD